MRTWRNDYAQRVARLLHGGFVALLELLLKIGTLFVAGFGVYVGYEGLKTWRRQLLGQVEYDLARRLALALSRLHHHVRYVRSASRPLLFTKAVPEGLGEQLFQFELVSHEAEVLWGEPFEEIRMKLSECVNRLILNLEQCYFIEDRPISMSAASREQPNPIIFGTADDEFGNKFEVAVAEMKEAIRPHFAKAA